MAEPKTLEERLMAALTDGRNGVFRHWHPWVARDICVVIVPIIKREIRREVKRAARDAEKGAKP